MSALLQVALGGAAGAALRYGTGLACMRAFGAAHWPWWLVAANALGSFLIGILWVLAAGQRMSPGWGLFLMTGLLGGYTTFSAFSLDAMRLLEDGRHGAAAAYVLGSVALCLAAAALGLRLARGLWA